MDLETENRIAAILLKEAAELRRQAQQEGALAYLREPTVRSRPNSRFLTATVRGVQQANRVVEVNEMWRLRDKQLELENKLKGEKHRSNGRGGYKDDSASRRSSSRGCHDMEASSSCFSHSSSKRNIQDRHPMDDEGFRDDEMEAFLHSRTKRGRGAVGSRMDETGPYPDFSWDELGSPMEEPKKARVFLGPEKPLSLKFRESSDDESIEHTRFHSSKHKKHKSEEKSKDKKKKKREEKKKRKHRK